MCKTVNIAILHIDLKKTTLYKIIKEKIINSLTLPVNQKIHRFRWIF